MTNGTSQGLFVVVAIIIFGIFVLISYMLFKDNLKPTLANIFTDGLKQGTCNLISECPIDIVAEREDETYLYAKIRAADESKGETEIWVRAEKLEDGTLQLSASSVSDHMYGNGDPDMTGSLVIPDTISGMKITSIYRNSSLGTFEQAVFTTLKLPNSLTTIGYKSFQNSIFSGELKLPSGLTSIGSSAFQNSIFSGEIKLASVERIGYKAFYSSEFSGTLDVSNVTVIREGAFNKSKINRVIRGEVAMSDDSTPYNNSGIHPQSIRLANGSWYDGSNG